MIYVQCATHEDHGIAKQKNPAHAVYICDLLMQYQYITMHLCNPNLVSVAIELQLLRQRNFHGI